MDINFSSLDFTFSKKPLLIGGKAMEYYGLRQAGADIDLVVPKSDLERLIQRHPHTVKDLWGDLGVAINGFEIWKSIDYFDYDYLSIDAIEEDSFFVISLEKLLLQKAMAMHKPKYLKDLELVVKKIKDNQHSHFVEIKRENEEMLSPINDVRYVEKSGPE
jgi:hypothetical protein